MTERRRWPCGTLVGDKLSPLRRHLVDAFGTDCVICHRNWSSFVDHDHRTGAVRGYLCRVCNNLVDRCLHLTPDCPYAAYLNDPPATRLQLTHPDSARRNSTARYLARQRCFDIVMAGGISPGHGRQPEPRGDLDEVDVNLASLEE